MYGMFSSRMHYQINKYLIYMPFCYSDSLREGNWEGKQQHFLPLATFYVPGKEELELALEKWDQCAECHQW